MYLLVHSGAAGGAPPSSAAPASSSGSISPAASSSFLLAARLVYLDFLISASFSSLFITHSLIYFFVGIKGSKAKDKILQIREIKHKIL